MWETKGLTAWAGSEDRQPLLVHLPSAFLLDRGLLKVDLLLLRVLRGRTFATDPCR